jgi:hypothetical protein
MATLTLSEALDHAKQGRALCATTCQIQWIDTQGNPTPDSNPAIACVRCKANEQIIAGRVVRFTQSEWFNICAEHAKQLSQPGMEIWECEPIAIPKHLKRWSMPPSYFGPSWAEYYTAGVGQSRDSDCLEQSNFAVMLAALGGESETVVVVRESHWAVGWVEWIAVHESDTTALKIADEQCARLAAYPILNEDDFGRREFEAQCEAWENAGLRGRMEYCHRAGISIFAARRSERPQDDNGRLGELLLGH